MIISGKAIADEIEKEIRSETETLSSSLRPTLAFLLIGHDPASEVYIRRKTKACERVGFRTRDYREEAGVSLHRVKDLIGQLNEDPAINGILIQLPLPAHLDPNEILELIDPEKDVDGFHPYNVGKLLLGQAPLFTPCTPSGILELLARTGISPKGKHTVILGRSNIVGKPLAALLMQKHEKADATVTVVHSHTERIEEYTRSADILIAAIGQPEYVTADLIKPGAVVIDVGINRYQDRLVGDVAFPEVAPLCSFITPVPGGVGPMTVAMLMKNTLKAFVRRLHPA